MLLIVDDDPEVGNVLHNMMTASGHNVILVDRGLKALSSLSQQPCDLVITDIVMPDMTGIKLIDKIRALYPDLKIIAISGGGLNYRSDVCVATAREHGAHRAMIKPITQNALFSMIQELLTTI